MGNADRQHNNLRPCLNTEGYGGEEPPSIKNGHNLFYGWEGSGGGREVHGRYLGGGTVEHWTKRSRYEIAGK